MIEAKMSPPADEDEDGEWIARQYAEQEALLATDDDDDDGVTEDDRIFWGNAAVPEQRAIAVYTDASGEIVIKQRYEGRGDICISVQPHFAQALAEAILTEVRDVHPTLKDRTAAERQKRYREKRKGGARDGDDRDAPLLREAAE